MQVEASPLALIVRHCRQERLAQTEEPWIKATILVPDAYLGLILALCEERRGVRST